jgi:hypothetical protein
MVPNVLTGLSGHIGETPSQVASSEHSVVALRQVVPFDSSLPYGQQPVPGVQSCYKAHDRFSHSSGSMHRSTGHCIKFFITQHNSSRCSVQGMAWPACTQP